MTVDVELHAFHGGGTLRPVDLPDDLADEDPGRVLPWVWHYGQNDHQPKPIRSVSMGDVIRLGGRRWSIRAVGFEPVAADYVPTERDWLEGSWAGCPAPDPDPAGQEKRPTRLEHPDSQARTVIEMIVAEVKKAIGDSRLPGHPREGPPGPLDRTYAAGWNEAVTVILARTDTLGADDALLARIRKTLGGPRRRADSSPRGPRRAPRPRRTTRRG